MRFGGRVKQNLVVGSALIIYLLLSLIYFGKSGDYGRMYLGYGGDPIAYIWFLNWWPWALAHGSDPFFSHYVWYPQGFNMTWAGSMPAAALLLWPVTAMANAVVSFNLLTLMAPALSAWFAFLLTRSLTQDAFASFIGGYLFGFSSYELGHLLGHLNLDLTFVIPLLAWLAVERLKGRLSRLAFIALFAVALLVQLGLATELLATACVFGGLTWAIFLAFARAEGRRQLWRLAGEIAAALAIMTVLAAPFLYYVFKDRAGVPSQIHPVEDYSADLLNYLVPTRVTHFGRDDYQEMSNQFGGNITEQGAYLGLPLILILILQLGDAARRTYVKPLLIGALVMVVSSLGPSLHVAGVTTGLWLPWRLAVHLPLINQALPTRFPLYVGLAAAVAVALWLSAARSGEERTGRFGLAGLACVWLLPNRGVVQHWTPLPSEPYFEPQNIAASLGDKANVILLPYKTSLFWQCQSGMRFTQSGGYVGFVPPSENKWPFILDLLNESGNASFENDASAYCFAHDVSAILVGPGTPRALAAAVDALPWQRTDDHGIRVVRVPDPRSLHFYAVSGDYWPTEVAEGWMGRELKVVTHSQPVQLCLTGRYRPAGLDPVEIRVVNGSAESHYRIGEMDTEVVRVPAGASVVLTANATFVPERIFHNGDTRQLSVALSCVPEAGLGRTYQVSGDYWPPGAAEGWMGRELKVVTHNRAVQLHLTGRYRPLGFEPVEIRVANGSAESHYRIGGMDTAVVNVPAGASVVLTANATFVPERTLHNGDTREVSVALSCIPEPGQDR